MFRTFGTLLLVASVTLLSPGARATDTESARRCAEIASDTSRLACYDWLFAPPTRTEQAKSSSTAPTTGSGWAAVGEDARRDFGLSEADKKRNGDLPISPGSISVTIQAISRRPTGEQIFKTNEGQVWVETESSSRVRVEPGETVTIRKAALGSYMLVTSKRAGAKVRRVN
jgi:hypothetical protein